MTYKIYNNENASGLPFTVFVTKNGKTERATYLGKRGTFKTYEEAERAVYNQIHYGTQNV